MIDIHSHLIYGVDDGSKSLEESIEILNNLANNGVTDIILTPHYITDTNYISSKTTNIIKFYNLKREIKKQGININIYLGNEIYIDPNILELVKENEMCSLNNSEYILIELPMSGNYPDYQDLIKNLMDIGFKVVLAHPERYASFQKDFNKVLEMVDMGVLLQCNIDSILGYYGSEAKNTMKLILKNKLVTFMGTDIHSTKLDYSYLERAKKKLKRYLTDEEINKILCENAKNIIKN